MTKSALRNNPKQVAKIKSPTRRPRVNEKLKNEGKAKKRAQKSRDKQTKDATVRARVNEKLKSDVSKILSEMGLNMSDAINILFRKIKLEGGIPFELKNPNKTTEQAFKDTDSRKNLTRHNNLEDLFRDLDI